MTKVKYPPEIQKGNGNIKVLYEKCHNIKELLEEVSDKIDDHLVWGAEMQAMNQKKFGMLEERTATTKNIVYSTLVIALGAIASALFSLFN